MYLTKQVIFAVFVSFACCAPSPGYLGGYHHHHHLPAATSYSSRIDIHGPEYVKTYATHPVVAKAYVAPVVKTVIPHYHEPLLSYGSYGYGLGHGYGYQHGLGYGYGHGLELGHYL